jgi:hypothetical protein
MHGASENGVRLTLDFIGETLKTNRIHKKFPLRASVYFDKEEIQQIKSQLSNQKYYIHWPILIEHYQNESRIQGGIIYDMEQ